MFAQVVRPFHKVLHFAKEHPVAFGLGFSCAKTSFADYLVQHFMEGRKRIDYLRNLTFAAFGFFYLGGVQYAIYVPLFRRMFPYAQTWTSLPLRAKLRDRKGIINMVQQVFLDQCVHHPLLYFPSFYAIKALVTGVSLASAAEAYKKNIFSDMLALWKIWVPATIINFTFSPFWFRIPFVACVSLVWTCILSAMRGATDHAREEVDYDLQESLDAVGNIGSAMEHFVYRPDNPLNIHIVLTATGPDRVGLVHEIARVIAENGGNIFQSRMSRLGGDFAMIVLVGVDQDHYVQLTAELTKIRDVSILTRETRTGKAKALEEGFTGDFSFWGPDQPGLVRRVMECFSQNSINIQTLKTEAEERDEQYYFSMKGTFSAPAAVEMEKLHAEVGKLRESFPPETKLHLTLQRGVLAEE